MDNNTDDSREIQLGLQEVMEKAKAEHKESVEKEAQDKVTEIVKNMGIFYTREDIDGMLKQLREENEAFKALLLRAKAQGKAHIQGDQENTKSKLAEYYKGTPLENAFK